MPEWHDSSVGTSLAIYRLNLKMTLKQKKLKEIMRQLVSAHHPRHKRRPYIHHSLLGSHAANIRETENAYFIDLIAPGREKGNFEVSVRDNVLILGIKAPEKEAEGKFVQREFTLAEADRKFRLPGSVNADAISAAYEAGILTLTLPKREEAQPRQIDIQ